MKRPITKRQCVNMKHCKLFKHHGGHRRHRKHGCGDDFGPRGPSGFRRLDSNEGFGKHCKRGHGPYGYGFHGSDVPKEFGGHCKHHGPHHGPRHGHGHHRHGPFLSGPCGPNEERDIRQLENWSRRELLIALLKTFERDTPIAEAPERTKEPEGQNSAPEECGEKEKTPEASDAEHPVTV